MTRKTAPGDKNHGKGRTFAAAWPVGFQGIAPVSDGGLKNPWQDDTRQGDAPSAHRRPGYSSSGCTPAEPDSASPGDSSLSCPDQAGNGSRANSDDSLDCRDVAKRKFLKVPSAGYRGLTWDRMPLKKQKNRIWASPWEICLDFFLLIGALQPRHTYTHATSGPWQVAAS